MFFHLQKFSACRNFDRKQVIEAGKATIQTCDVALDLYNQIIDKIGATDHTKETAKTIVDMKTSLTDGIGFYEKAPKLVINWCNTVTPLASTYKDKKTAGKDQLIKSLDDGQVIMDDAKNGLSKCSKNMNVAGGKLYALENILKNDFDVNIKWIISWQNETIHTVVPELNQKVESIREFFEEFVCTENKVTKAYMDIGDVINEIVTTKTFVQEDQSLQDEAIQSAEQVIAKCNEYRKKYE